MLLIAALGMGCVDNAPVQESIKESIEEPEFDIKVTRVYTDDVDWTKIVYSIENTGNVPVTWLKVSAYLLNDNGNVIAVKTGYPSGYSDYGLKPGQILYASRIFTPAESYGCVSGGIKILDYKV